MYKFKSVQYIKLVLHKCKNQANNNLDKLHIKSLIVGFWTCSIYSLEFNHNIALIKLEPR